MMASFRRASLLTILLLLTPKVLALQVTPNSPCASVCMDDAGDDVSDPNSSNTYASDIVCSDSDYASTVAGKKLESCINCLTNSTVSSQGENDQAWLLYHLRYGLDTCLFSFPNASSNTISTPCNLEASCGPLKSALTSGYLNPSNESTYSYCSADDNALLGATLPKCISCLQDVATETYLANCEPGVVFQIITTMLTKDLVLTVLQAGCIQQPPAGTNVGFRGNIFSSSLIKITYPGDKRTATHKKGLPQGAIIGIVVGTVLLVLVAMSVGYVCFRKTRYSRNMKRLKSPRASKWTKTISSPSTGDSGRSYASPSTQTPHQFDVSTLSAKELTALGLAAPNLSNQFPGATMMTEQNSHYWQDAHAQIAATENQRQVFPVAAMPTHQAYIPNHRDAVSPATSFAASTLTYEQSPYSSAKTSPASLPPGAALPLPSPPSLSHNPAPLPVFKPGIKAIPPPLQVSVPRIITTPQLVQPAQFSLPTHQEETSHIPRPGLRSQKGEPPRHNSIAGGWRRDRSTSRNGRNQSASRNGGGNRSTSRNGLRDTLASMECPVLISGPMIQHGGRYDMDSAQRVMEEGDATAFSGTKHPDATPSSAESEEQWPGSY